MRSAATLYLAVRKPTPFCLRLDSPTAQSTRMLRTNWGSLPGRCGQPFSSPSLAISPPPPICSSAMPTARHRLVARALIRLAVPRPRSRGREVCGGRCRIPGDRRGPMRDRGWLIRGAPCAVLRDVRPPRADHMLPPGQPSGGSRIPCAHLDRRRPISAWLTPAVDVAARDLGWIGTLRQFLGLEATLATMGSSIKRFACHLFQLVRNSDCAHSSLDLFLIRSKGQPAGILIALPCLALASAAIPPMSAGHPPGCRRQSWCSTARRAGLHDRPAYPPRRHAVNWPAAWRLAARAAKSRAGWTRSGRLEAARLHRTSPAPLRQRTGR